MNRNLRGLLWAWGAAIVGTLIVGQLLVYGLLRIQPGDRTDLLALAIIGIVSAVLGFWWGRRTGGASG